MKVKTYTDAWDVQVEFDPGGCIQWSGSNICIDIHCKCGHDYACHAPAPHTGCGECECLWGRTAIVERGSEYIVRLEKAAVWVRDGLRRPGTTLRLPYAAEMAARLDAVLKKSPSCPHKEVWHSLAEISRSGTAKCAECGDRVDWWKWVARRNREKDIRA